MAFMRREATNYSVIPLGISIDSRVFQYGFSISITAALIYAPFPQNLSSTHIEYIVSNKYWCQMCS